VEKKVFSLERKPDGSFHGFEWKGTALLRPNGYEGQAVLTLRTRI
jgi:hypothetical protein